MVETSAPLKISVWHLRRMFLTRVARAARSSVTLLEGLEQHTDLWMSSQVPSGGFRVALTWGTNDDPVSLSVYTPSGCVIDAQGASCTSDGVDAHAESWRTEGGGPQSVLFREASAAGAFKVFATIAGGRDEEWGLRGARAVVFLPECGAFGVRRFLLRVSRVVLCVRAPFIAFEEWKSRPVSCFGRV